MAYKNIGQNTVLVIGVVNNGTASNTTQIFTLPTAYRPLTQQAFPTIEITNVYGNSVVVQTNGEVKMYSAAGAGTYFIGFTYSLDIT
jgi:hypothetical protein